MLYFDRFYSLELDLAIDDLLIILRYYE